MLKKPFATIFTLASLASPTMAGTSYYTVRMNDVYIGEFTFSHDFEDGEYESALTAETLGFGKSIIDASFEGKTTGQGERYRQYFPANSEMTIDAEDYQNEYQIEFSDGQFEKASNDLDEAYEIDFTSIANAVDPLTAFSYVFRPLDFDHLCEMKVDIVDGVYHRRLILGSVERRQDGRWQCRGAIERVAGYEESELIERPNYKVNAVYQSATQTEFYLDRAVVETPWGEIEIAFEYEISEDGEPQEEEIIEVEAEEVDVEVIEIDETN